VQPAPAQAVPVDYSEADTVVVTRARSVLAYTPHLAKSAQEENVVLLMPVIGSPMRMRRTQSVNSASLQSPTATRREKAGDADDKFTPVKLNVAQNKVRGKDKGVNRDDASGVMRSPSGREFMFKPVTQDEGMLDISLIETLNEIISGNLFRLYLGKNRAPTIGLCTSQLTSESRVGVSSDMFSSFSELWSEKLDRNQKPDGFEAIMVTSLFLGDADPNKQNVGFNQARELSKIDHGRTFLVSYKNGKDFLQYLFDLCNYHQYPYSLSYDAIKAQLILIRDCGLESAFARVDDAFSQIEKSMSEFHKPPFAFPVYDPSRWVDPIVRARLFSPIPRGYKRVERWADYKKYITTMLQGNYSIIDDALTCLAEARASGEEREIHLHPLPTKLVARKDFLVEIGVIDKSARFPVQGTDFPYRDVMLDSSRLLDLVGALTDELALEIIGSLDAKKSPTDKKMRDKDGLLVAMGLSAGRPVPAINRPATRANMLVAPREPSHALASHIVLNQSYVGKLNAEMSSNRDEMKRD
jgi:hypothetical protein